MRGDLGHDFRSSEQLEDVVVVAGRLLYSSLAAAGVRGVE